VEQNCQQCVLTVSHSELNLSGVRNISAAAGQLHV